MTSQSFSLGFSPCPNDTFIFYALVHGLIAVEGATVSRRPHLEDVETLNRWALEGRLDITKLSYHAYGHVQESYALLHSGSALGRGCGPLLVCHDKRIRASDLDGCTIGIPGRLTTAAMLLRLFAPRASNLRQMRFDTIMPALVNGEIDAGVIIHESRFTYPQFGLSLLQDLGQWWELQSGCPIPLGGIAVRRSLGGQVIAALDAAVRKSVLWAFANRGRCMDYIRSHAQEMDDEVIASHIDLYVNEFSVDLGEEGTGAIERFLRKGVEAGIFPSSSSPWKEENRG